MSKRIGLILSVLAIFIVGSVSAQTVPVADRGLVVGEGKGEVGFDLNIGLDKDLAFKRFGVGNAYAFDRYSGLSFGYGLMKELELGLALGLGYFDKKTEVDGFKLTGVTLYGKYEFVENMVGAELGVYIPGYSGGAYAFLDKFGDQLLGVRVGIPFQYIASPGMLKIHARPDFLVGFAKKEYAVKSPQMTFVFDAGATFNATPELFFDLTFGFGYQLKPSKSDLNATSKQMIQLPLAVTAGYTLMPEMDLYLNFALNDLYTDGGVMDAKSLGLGLAYRF